MKFFLLTAVASAVVLAGCSDGTEPVAPDGGDVVRSQPSFTRGTGSLSTLLGRATFSDPKDRVFKVKRITGNWHMELKATPAFDLAVQTITFQAGGQSGWHSHPGPVLIQVVAGTMTFYESTDPTCTPTTRTAGQSFLDYGDHAHIARNETGAVAQTLVTYFAPPGVPLRIDEPNPGDCPF